MKKKSISDVREESSEDSSDSTSGDNFSIYTETSSSEEDLQNVEESGMSTSSATTHNSHKGKLKSSWKQPTVKRSKRQQLFFAGKAYLKVKLGANSSICGIQNSHQNRSKNKLVREKTVTRAHGSCSLRVMGSWIRLLPQKQLEDFYIKVILPSVTYGLTVWGSCNNTGRKIGFTALLTGVKS